MPVGALAAVLGLGVWAIVYVKYWREETRESVSDVPNDLLDQYEKLVEEGLLQPEELARIKEQLARKADAEISRTDDSPSSEPPPAPVPPQE